MADATVHDLLGKAPSITNSSTPQLDCQLMLCHVLKKPRSWLFAHDDAALGEGVMCRYLHMIERRQRGEPVAYIVGFKDFWKSRLAVTPATLVPRPETELLVETALSALPADPCTVLDLGTGSGAIAISLALERRDWTVVASDLYRDALAVAMANRKSATNLHFFQGDWSEAVAGKQFDMVVCNPPYVQPDDPHLDSLSAEPRSALVSEGRGLSDIERVIADVRRILRPGGVLIMEHGADQQRDVHGLLEVCGYVDSALLSDLNGLPRAVKCRTGGATAAPLPPQDDEQGASTNG